ncbi:MAG TPA: diphthamide biosynthesis enzyme Dph2, partial [Candidatus Altiarchaeales archaeon]|nr:diphthamide biosynthesis enzyme Dph2 [Candidatus Altiarchaeales archaeon]
VKKNNARRVYVQLPEGLKTSAIDIAEKIESETGAVVLTQVDPCYGACDINEDEIEKLGVDMIIHFGHTPFEKK